MIIDGDVESNPVKFNFNSKIVDKNRSKESLTYSKNSEKYKSSVKEIAISSEFFSFKRPNKKDTYELCIYNRW